MPLRAGFLTDFAHHRAADSCCVLVSSFIDFDAVTRQIAWAGETAALALPITAQT